MATPKVNLRQRKDKKGTSYFIDFTVNGKRYRIAAGNNKKRAASIQREYDARLLLG